MLFLSRSSYSGGDTTTCTSSIIFLGATPPSPIHIVNDALPIVYSTLKMCCPRQCLQQHSEQVTDINASFHWRNQRDQTQFLLDMFHVTKGGSTHLLNGEKVCRNAFLAVFGISRRRYLQVLKEYLRGSIKALCKPTSRTITAKTTNAEAWMAKYFESISDRMPHNGQLHLLHVLSKRDVYYIHETQNGEPENTNNIFATLLHDIDDKPCSIFMMCWFADHSIWIWSNHNVLKQIFNFFRCLKQKSPSQM